jgi:hypothetical protein
MREVGARRKASGPSQYLVLALSMGVLKIKGSHIAVRAMIFVVSVVTTRENKERGEALKPDSLLGSCGLEHVEWLLLPLLTKTPLTIDFVVNLHLT